MDPGDALDDEISSIRSQIKHLSCRRSLFSTALLSSRSLQTRLERVQSSHSAAKAALSLVRQQHKQNLANLYRSCAGITAFKVQDPDPCAVDGGKVLGVRIEVFVNGAFIAPYYLLLHRANAPFSQALTLHKHTVPPAIPLKALLARHLPQPTQTAPDPKQDLPRLARVLRHELASYHFRLAAVEKLRQGAGLSDATAGDQTTAGERAAGGMGPAGRLSAVSHDATGQGIRLEWTDGTVGRVAVAKDGLLERAVVWGREEWGRRSEIESRILGGDGRVEQLADRLVWDEEEPQRLSLDGGGRRPGKT